GGPRCRYARPTGELAYPGSPRLAAEILRTPGPTGGTPGQDRGRRFRVADPGSLADLPLVFTGTGLCTGTGDRTCRNPVGLESLGAGGGRAGLPRRLAGPSGPGPVGGAPQRGAAALPGTPRGPAGRRHHAGR